MKPERKYLIKYVVVSSKPYQHFHAIVGEEKLKQAREMEKKGYFKILEVLEL
jgi:hypothetical protein